jgi:hypothetical protein
MNTKTWLARATVASIVTLSGISGSVAFGDLATANALPCSQCTVTDPNDAGRGGGELWTGGDGIPGRSSGDPSGTGWGDSRLGPDGGGHDGAGESNVPRDGGGGDPLPYPPEDPDELHIDSVPADGGGVIRAPFPWQFCPHDTLHGFNLIYRGSTLTDVVPVCYGGQA